MFFAHVQELEMERKYSKTRLKRIWLLTGLYTKVRITGVFIKLRRYKSNGEFVISGFYCIPGDEKRRREPAGPSNGEQQQENGENGEVNGNNPGVYPLRMECADGTEMILLSNLPPPDSTGATQDGEIEIEVEVD